MDVVLAHASPAVRAAKQATSIIPIVMMGAGDPVGTGFVVSLARNPANPVSALQFREIQAAARSLGIETQTFDVQDPMELESVFSVIATARADALTVIADPMFLSERNQIANLTMTKRVPSVFARNENVKAGGLMSARPWPTSFVWPQPTWTRSSRARSPEICRSRSRQGRIW